MKPTPDFSQFAYDQFSFAGGVQPTAAVVELWQTYEQIPVKPVFTADDLPRHEAVDRPPVRRVFDGRGVERLLQAQPCGWPSRTLGGFRSGDASRL